MSKLTLPVNPLLGSPLTDEELKSIIGGQTDASRSCTCTYYYHGGASGTETVAADNETACGEKCHAACAELGSCINAMYHYDAEGYYA